MPASIGDADGSTAAIDIDRAEFKFNWDAAERVSRSAVPNFVRRQPDHAARAGRGAGATSAAPGRSRSAAARSCSIAAGAQGEPLILNRIAVSGQFDPSKKRFIVDQGDVGNTDLGVAMSGNADYSSGESASARRLRRHAHVGRCAQAAVAGLRRAQGARLVQRASCQRHMWSTSRSR